MIKLRTDRLKIGFILDHPLMHYREAFFRQLASRGFEITVFHSGEVLESYDNFAQVKVMSVKYKGVDFKRLPSLSSFDVVVCMQNFWMINLWFLSLNPFRSFALIHWGIGTSSSKGLRPDKTIVSRFRNFLAGFASAQILYSPVAVHLFSKRVQAKTFIANNTVDNPSSVDLSSRPKDSVLFIGTLNKRKGLDILIRSFLKFVEYQPRRIHTLRIIGEGAIKQQLLEAIEDNQYKSQVQFIGKLEDSQQKLEYFRDSVICVSPKQAGLSILESFSYGVPFVTFRDCISGGEHLNIIDGINGYIIDTEDSLVEIFKELERNPALGSRLGKNAFNHYSSSRRMKDMLDSFENAIKYVLTK